MQSGLWLDLKESIGVVPELNTRDEVLEFENAVGGQANDVIAGSEAANSMKGGNGDDVIAGRGGIDTLVGSGGDDTLVAGVGDDVLVGDREDAYNGADRGRDVFAFSAGGDRDRIDDFEQGKDVIDLSGYANIHTVEGLKIINMAMHWESGKLKSDYTEIDLGASNGGPADVDVLTVMGGYANGDFIFS